MRMTWIPEYRVWAGFTLWGVCIVAAFAGTVAGPGWFTEDVGSVLILGGVVLVLAWAQGGLQLTPGKRRSVGSDSSSVEDE